MSAAGITLASGLQLTTQLVVPTIQDCALSLSCLDGLRPENCQLGVHETLQQLPSCLLGYHLGQTTDICLVTCLSIPSWHFEARI